ncbi:MAG: chemotaxis protein CheW [Spirochaetales bacterium]|nr:chemotaxis protein CheW [Spirochaetales bacterium]
MSAMIDEAIERQEEKQQKKIDFKMVTFSLAGRDYGIDIMKVDGISKIDKYTYVPNTYPFVKGVYNLRGDIISIIDMGKMFHIQQPAQAAKDDSKLENILIIKSCDLKIGVIVDSVDKVLGISRESMQDPPSLFGDINIKYISGVTEVDDRLYIILDTDKIFSEEEEKKAYQTESDEIDEHDSIETMDSQEESASPGINFIIETLNTFSRFHVSPVNRKWVEHRYDQWVEISQKRGQEPQLVDEADANEFLQTFFSRETHQLWSDEYREKMESILPAKMDGPLDVWNPGCGKGFESYSLACLLKRKYPENRIKVWANDSNLLEISMATNIVLQKAQIPAWINNGGFIQDGSGGKVFTKAVKDALYFEFHDIKHKNMVPNMNLIVARDLLSYLEPEGQKKVLDEFHGKLKSNGILVLGENESIEHPGFRAIEAEALSAYVKE